MIEFYHWNALPDARKTALLRRSQATIDAIADKVRPIIDDVAKRGDAALIDCAAKFDRATLKDLRVPQAEIDGAAIDPAHAMAIDRANRNVQVFHAEQMRHIPKEWMIEVEPGVFAGERVTPLDSVGLYVPGGKNPFPSALYMLGIPAVMAGVQQIVVTTPPRADGTIHPAILYAARKLGLSTIIKSGGAQAIAALAHGTESVPRVDKVLGPGSPYVAAAKSALSGIIDPGMPAGPSESIVLCDETADPHNTVLDVLNEAEHGPDSATLLLTHDRALAEFVSQNLQHAIDALPEPQRGWLNTVFADFGAIILTDSLQQSIDIANAYAPEHLLLKVRNPEAVIPRLTNAGEILVGEYSAFTLGNYATGVNHVLPTGGWARSHSCTGVWDFLKRTSVSRVTKEGFLSLQNTGAILAEAEGFPAHKNALTNRKILRAPLVLGSCPAAWGSTVTAMCSARAVALKTASMR